MKEMNCATGINFCWLPLVAMRTFVDACHVKTCQVNVAYWWGWCYSHIFIDFIATVCWLASVVLVVNYLFVVAVAVAVAFEVVVAA